ncbi:MAG: SdiA-regulated domain-containing protein [gamma proteobacterium symbiont of Taylorina sp.]|nr:SdiA-regulated domain-containing protein [gamma proteobacterium symbiont of Taylorina sp.]
MQNNQQSFHLMFLNSFDLKNKAEGLREPSGLVLSYEKNALWTVSDDTNKIFKISLTGNLIKDQSFSIPDTELEGITLIEDGKFLLVVKESTNELIKINTDTQVVSDRKCLSEMQGYDAISAYFSNNSDNKGLEGITWNQNTASLFVIKEANPGLLIEISSDLQRIMNHYILNDENGFYDQGLKPEEIDFSDICYDQNQGLFWIISDKARRLFLYDLAGNKVLQSSKLVYTKKGKDKAIKKAEGIAINLDENRLYIVSDKTTRLYVFDITW